MAIGAEIIDVCRELERRGLNQGTAGNVSVRAKKGWLVTPSGRPYASMKPAELVEMDMKGGHAAGKKPSSEWRLHLDAYKTRPDVGAVIHTHSGYATTLACLRRPIPAFHYMIAFFGGSDIRCSDYATYGTQELSDEVMKALEGRQAALMGSHGLIVVAPTLAKALALTIEAETLAMMYWRAIQVKEPVILPDAEIDRVRAKAHASGYGK